MVKLTADLITKSVGAQNKRRPDETSSHYLSRLTHMYLQEKHINEIDLKIPICKNLTVIYLYDNDLTQIDNFEFAPNLTHLYLQNNQIKRIENLTNLTKLTKLHIGGNQIRVLEGLENLTELVELHIENQKLPPGEKLLFDPRTLVSLVPSLEILNVSNNNLDTLSEIGPLVNLKQLNASKNNLNDMKEISVLLKCWPKLWSLELNGNPICLKNKYRERIIVQAQNIQMLDGKEIQELSRQFLTNWKTSKEITRNKNDAMPIIQDPNQLQLNSYFTFNNSNNVDLSQMVKLANVNTIANQVNGSNAYVMPEHKKKQFGSINGKQKLNYSQENGVINFSAANNTNKIMLPSVNYNQINASFNQTASNEAYYNNLNDSKD